MIRILYALGPGNVVDAYKLWRRCEEDYTQPPRTFSGQFFDFCEATGAAAYAISSHAERAFLLDHRFTIENRPKILQNPRGMAYHLNQLAYGVSIMVAALRYRAQVVIVDSGTTHWFTLAPLTIVGVRVIASLHNALWPMGFRPRGVVKRAMMALDGWFWRRCADATLCVSPECARQVREVARIPHGPVVEHRAQYRRGVLDTVSPPPPHDYRPFRVLFAGRVERNKGVFDIVAAAQQLRDEFPGQFAWDVCGTGSDFDELRRTIQERKLDDTIVLRGLQDQFGMRNAYARAHVVIVPTRSECAEAFAMVAAEAVLAGRPVVGSSVVPALEVLGKAGLCAECDRPESYVTALRQLFADRTYYEVCCQACFAVQHQFFDPQQGLAAALERVFARLGLSVSTPAPEFDTPAGVVGAERSTTGGDHDPTRR